MPGPGSSHGLAALVATAALALVLGACGGAGGRHAGEVRVLRVVDGDTIVVRLASGRVERVRYIGIDTPESVRPGTPVQCFAKAAARENARLVGVGPVRLVADAERRDRYGRLLAYVYARGRFVNAALALGGYARPLTIPPNVAHVHELGAAADAARAAGRGLWGRC